MYLRRAVDDEGEVLDILVQARRDKNAALRLMRKLRKNQRQVPTSIVTDRYRAYDAALRDLGLSRVHRRGKRLNNRAESSHVMTNPTTRAQDARLSICRIGFSARSVLARLRTPENPAWCSTAAGIAFKNSSATAPAKTSRHMAIPLRKLSGTGPAAGRKTLYVIKLEIGGNRSSAFVRLQVERRTPIRPLGIADRRGGLYLSYEPMHRGATWRSARSAVNEDSQNETSRNFLRSR
jgi:hypothetical protein